MAATPKINFWPWFPIHSFRQFFARKYCFATIQNVTDDRRNTVPKAHATDSTVGQKWSGVSGTRPEAWKTEIWVWSTKYQALSPPVRTQAWGSTVSSLSGVSHQKVILHYRGTRWPLLKLNFKYTLYKRIWEGSSHPRVQYQKSTWGHDNNWGYFEPLPPRNSNSGFSKTKFTVQNVAVTSQQLNASMEIILPLCIQA